MKSKITDYFPKVKKQKIYFYEIPLPTIHQANQQQQQYSTDEQQCHQIGSCRYTARMSKDRVHRYQLTRTWDRQKGKVLFIMCNPSTADAVSNDRTITRITNFTKSWGYGGFVVGNLFAFRSPHPKDLKTAQDPKGKKNKKYLRRLIKDAEMVVYAWGCNRGCEPEWLREIMTQYSKVPYCIDITKKGEPRHPLMLKKDLQPSKYRQRLQQIKTKEQQQK